MTHGIPDAEMLERAVRGARSREYRKGQKHYRWIAVMDLFSLGSTAAQELCLRFDLDPDEQVNA